MEEINLKPIKVYVKIDNNNNIIDVNSELFINDYTGYIFIAEGYGDKYAHSQSQFFEKPLVDQFGNYNYKLVGNNYVNNY